MCLPRVRVVVVMFLALAARIAVADDSVALQRRFEREYPAALRSLMDYYGRLTMEVEHEWTRVAPGRQAPSGERIECATRGQSIRVLTYPGTSHLAEHDPAAKVSVANPRLSFSLSRSAESRGFQVNGIDSFEGRLGSIRVAAWALFAPYCIQGETVHDLVRDQGFRWQKFERLAEAEELVRAHFLLSVPDVQGDMMGWFIFAPRYHWALRGWRLDYAPNPGKSFREAEIIYRNRPSREGIPLLSRVIYRVYYPERAEATNEEVWKFLRIEPAEVPESAFTLPAFGLPDVAPEIDPRVRMRWIMLTGLAAIVVAAALAWARARRTRQPAAPA